MLSEVEYAILPRNLSRYKKPHRFFIRIALITLCEIARYTYSTPSYLITKSKILEQRPSARYFVNLDS